MAQPVTFVLSRGDRTFHWSEQTVIVISASLFFALCARVTLPLPFTPVPLTLQNSGVLLVGLTLGLSGFAALALYLAEGVAGMPVFNPTGPGGVAQLLGASGGFLLAYPAGLAGWIMECGRTTFARAAAAGVLAEVVLVGGLSWLAVLTHSVAEAARFGLYWFLFAEVIKVMLAAGVSTGWQRVRKEQA